jgi:GNAT superfamily N-acetyltransferase
MRIRPAKPSEAGRLTGLTFRSKRHWSYDDNFMRLAAEQLTVRSDDVNRGCFFVAESEVTGDLLGFYALAETDDLHGELAMLFVEPAHIGTGLGRALMSDAVERAIAKGWTTLRIEADPFAASFYERMGAVLMGSVPSGSIPGRDLPLYQLNLVDPPEGSTQNIR